jgi:CDP-6-deoxy-D-xylo-4-hexulose-3-dehydrase
MNHKNLSNQELKDKILGLTREYSARLHVANRPGYDPANAPFIPGKTPIPYAGRVFTEDEVEAAVSSTLDFWLTLGPEGDKLQTEFAAFLGVRHSLLVNSGSSANLIAVSALTSPKLSASKRIIPGDEVITSAAGFPTTVAPIIQCGAVPVFIDNHPHTGNACMNQLEGAYVPGRTKAVMMAHTLGNPFELVTVLEFCHKHDLWLIEDNCDALGCTYTLPLEKAKAIGLSHLIKIAEQGTHPLIQIHNQLKTATLTAPTGSFGDLSTQSFYPPHHLTMGEGGAVNIIRRPQLKTLAESFRDWGRDCWCPSGKDNSCNKRFGWQLGELPEGYDHKYIYSHLGYNVKPLDPQAAIGRQQMKKLPAFIKARKENWDYLRAGLDDLSDHFEFALPTHATEWTQDGFTWDESGCRSNCSWFGFMMLVKESSHLTHRRLACALNERKIGNRMLFGGNLVRQPAFVRLRQERPEAIRIPVELTGADQIMNQAIFIGTYPGLTNKMLDYIVQAVREIVAEC